jgi:hypothetical protein
MNEEMLAKIFPEGDFPIPHDIQTLLFQSYVNESVEERKYS